jgi:hypothetical protein
MPQVSFTTRAGREVSFNTGGGGGRRRGRPRAAPMQGPDCVVSPYTLRAVKKGGRPYKALMREFGSAEAIRNAVHDYLASMTAEPGRFQQALARGAARGAGL